MKFYYHNLKFLTSKCCCEHMIKDLADEKLKVKCYDNNRIKIFAKNEKLAKYLTECPYCHEKIETIYEED